MYNDNPNEPFTIQATHGIQEYTKCWTRDTKFAAIGLAGRLKYETGWINIRVFYTESGNPVEITKEIL